MRLKEKIENIFSKYKFNYDYEYINEKQVLITIKEGDWKHDHLYLKNILSANGFTLEDEYYAESDDDCYDVEYTFQLN